MAGRCTACWRCKEDKRTKQASGSAAGAPQPAPIHGTLLQWHSPAPPPAAAPAPAPRHLLPRRGQRPPAPRPESCPARAAAPASSALRVQWHMMSRRSVTHLQSWPAVPLPQPNAPPIPTTAVKPIPPYLHPRLKLQRALLRQLLRLLRLLCSSLSIRPLLRQLLPLLCRCGGLHSAGGNYSIGSAHLGNNSAGRGHKLRRR